MLDLDHLRECLQALDGADKGACQKALRALKTHTAEDWTSAPDEIAGLLVTSLAQLLFRSREQTGKLLAAARQDVVIVLSNLGPRAAPALPELVALLAGGIAQNLREAAVVALGRMGPAARAAVEHLIRLLDGECPVTLAARVARALCDIGDADPRACDALARIWRVSILFPESRIQVAVALVRFNIDVPGLLPALTNSVAGDASAPVRRAAAEALGWRGKDDRDVVPALTIALYDEDEEVRRLAESALGRIPLTCAQAIEWCGAHLHHSAHAEAALKKSGVAAVPVLIGALHAVEPLARVKAARILGSLGEAAQAAASALSKNLRDEEREVCLAAAKALWNIARAADEVVPALVGLLTAVEDTAAQDGESRRKYIQTVLEALARIGRPAQAAIPAILRRSKDENRLVRETALRALRDIDPVTAPR